MLEPMPKPLKTYMINNAAAQIWSLSALHFIADNEEMAEADGERNADPHHGNGFCCLWRKRSIRGFDRKHKR